jgi:hypothetical protein
MRELNLCLLGSWLGRYSKDSDKIWKQIVDYKYDTCKPNIFTCREVGASNFWKGVMLAAKVAKMGFRWKFGNGAKIRFLEDVWIASTSLAIQFWDIYCIINEHNQSAVDLWDVVDLRCTFRRCVDMRPFLLWEEVMSIASSITQTSEEDEMIWQFSSTGLYSSHSLYRVINFRGVLPVYLPTVWSLVIPPRV